MNYPCEIIQDLLPLYEEDICSEASRRMVEDHLQQCPECRRLTMPIPELTPVETPAADQAVAKGLKRTRRKWRLSLLAVLMVSIFGLMLVNRYWGNGLSPANVNEMVVARRFVTALEEARWADAAAMVDFSDDYDSIREALEEHPASGDDTFSPVEFDGETWYTRLPLNDMGKTLEETILAVLQNDWGQVMIPVEVMDSILAKDIEGIWQDGEWYNLWQFTYRRIETPWGTYVCAHNSGDAEAYLYTSDLVPEAVYEAAMTERQLDLQAAYQATWEAYGHVASMTEEEFCTYMREKYAMELAEFAASEELTITNGGLASVTRAYLTDEDAGWEVRYRLNLRHGGEETVKQLSLVVVDGTLRSPGIRQITKITPWDRELHKAIYPSAHPDY